MIVRRILLTSGLDDAIYFTPPTIAGDNRQYILLSKSEHTVSLSRNDPGMALQGKTFA